MKIVKTRKGTLAGMEYDGYSAFLGIPYAKPPINELRWRPPLRPDRWDGIMQADKFSTREYQLPQGPETFYGKEFYSDTDFLPEMSEDCLYLNIWTPAKEKEEKYPVAFWIHGGAFMHGFGSEMEFDGEAFCKRGVVLVTINYRVGAFGFLCHPSLAAENKNSHCGNYGILDQIAALKWVNENIECFGGDPEQITVFGQSAGAMSAQILSCSAMSEGLFQRAIFQSGGGYHTGIGSFMAQEEAETLGIAYSQYLGADTVESLRRLTPNQLMDGVIRIMESGRIKGLPFAPVIDGYVLDSSPDDYLENGYEHDIDYMLGSNKNDLGTTEEDVNSGRRGRLWRACIDFSVGRERHGKSAAYVYSFDRQLPGDDAGAFHSAELWYVFGTLGRSWRMMPREDLLLSSMMTDYWCNFIKTGNPNGDGLPEWRRCAENDEHVIIFDV